MYTIQLPLSIIEVALHVTHYQNVTILGNLSFLSEQKQYELENIIFIANLGI